jgi:uncharacterized protein YhfF
MIFLVLDQVHNVLCTRENNVLFLPSENIIKTLSSQLVIWKDSSLIFDNQTEIYQIFIYKAQKKPKVSINDSVELLWIPIREILHGNSQLEKKSTSYVSKIYRETVLGGFSKKLQNYDVWYFGSDKEEADELVALVLIGKKTATTTLLEELKIENEKIPEVGDVSLVVNWEGIPKCIIETTRVYISPFNKVPKDHATKEGEGDSSYDYWRNGHLRFFTKIAQSQEIPFTETSNVVCEEFRVLQQIP